MEVVNYVRVHFNWRSKRTKIVIVFLFFAVVVANVIPLFSGGTLDGLNFLDQVIFSTIIVIWVYFAPKLYEKFSNIKKCFDIVPDSLGRYKNDAFQNLYESSRKDVYLLDKQNQGKKFFYIISWVLLCVCYFIGYYYFGMIAGNVLNIVLTAVLYALSVFLNGFSWYISVLYTLFLVKVSRMTNQELNQLPHNKYIPSLSSGIKELLLYAEDNSIIFLIVSLLYAVGFFISFKLTGQQNIDFFSQEGMWFVFLTFLVLLPGMITYLVIFLSPRYFLRRILRRWKYQTLRELEHDLYQAQNDGDANKVRLYNSNIQVVAEDKLRYESNSFEFVLAFTTIFSNFAIIYNIFYI